MDTSALGVSDFGPVAGSPMVPPLVLPVIVVLSLVLGIFLWRFFRTHRTHATRDAVRSGLLAAFLMDVLLLACSSAFLAYWFVPNPGIASVEPPANRRFSTTGKISLHFDRPVDRKSLEKSIEPDTPGRWVFEDPVYTTHLYRTLTFYPTFSLRPDTAYTIRLSGIRNFIHAVPADDYLLSFLTAPAPGVSSVTPADGAHDISPTESLMVKLDSANGHMSEFSFRLEPETPITVATNPANTAFTIRPLSALLPATQYTVETERTDLMLNLETGAVVSRNPGMVFRNSFKTSGTEHGTAATQTAPVSVPRILPDDGATDVATDAKITILFTESVDRSSAEQHFSIEPAVAGLAAWAGNRMTFTPNNALAYGTQYTAALSPGTKTTSGVTAKATRSTFTTQTGTVKLAVPAYFQQYTLSCEASALRMALAFKGVRVSEDEILAKIGTDRTPHTGNVWGDPYEAFVGNVSGTQMADGYGVYWGPIARAARAWRPASEFSGWSVSDLTREIRKGNPVVIWVYAAGGTRTSWNTPAGKNIFAVRDEHSVVAVGFAGPADNPTSIIINDPRAGQVYWPRRTFDSKWAIFGNSGVVVN